MRRSEPTVGMSRTPRSLLVALGVTLLALAAVALVARDADVTIGLFTNDPTPWYAGILSVAGLLLWTTCAATCALTAVVLGETYGPSLQVRGFAASAAITLLLLADDWLQLHETVLPRHLGIAETVASLAIAAVGVVYVVHVRQWLRAGETGLFATAVVLGGVSQAIDLGYEFAVHVLPAALGSTVARGGGFVEDGTKLLGLVALTVFFARAARGQLAARHLQDASLASLGDSPDVRPREDATPGSRHS